MSGFVNMKAIVDSENQGRSRYATFRKAVAQVTTAGVWFDLSMSPGNPAPQYYIGAINAATPMRRSTDGGLDHGQPVGPGVKKYIRTTTLFSNSGTGLPLPVIGLDYLMFYPFVDESSTDYQEMINVNTLPRYTDGAGVQMMLVSVASRAGGASLSVTYTNQDGVSGRNTGTVIENTAAANGNIVSSQTANNLARGPFMPLQAGDIGVRSIDGVQMITPDVGLFTIVLVKPLFQTQIRGVDAVVEKDHLLDSGQLPQIYDDAYLNMICLPSGSLSGVSLYGDIKTTWN